MSGSLLPNTNLYPYATPLGSVRMNAQRSALGSVGMTSASRVYGFSLAASSTVSITLSGLR